MKVHLIAPSSPVDKNHLDVALTVLKDQGFEVTFLPTLLDKHYLFAGTKERRAAELLTQLNNTHADIVWCARGGYGSSELLPALKEWLATHTPHPKHLIGFSDATPLQNTLALNTPLRVIYGLAAAIPDFPNMPTENWTWLKQLLTQNQGKTHPLEFTFFRSSSLSGKLISGKLIGGNLSMLISLLGTPDDISYDGKILFLEDVNEPDYRIVRMLNHLIVAGKLKNITGLIFGRFNTRNTHEDILPMKPILDYLFPNPIIPIIYNFPCGHTQECVPLPLNTPIHLSDSTLSFHSE